MRGKVVSWLGDKGYGFIASDEGRGNQNIFFHLSNVKKAIRQPQVGDFVVFVLRKDDKGKFKAVDVILEGVPPLNTGQPHSACSLVFGLFNNQLLERNLSIYLPMKKNLIGVS